MTTDPFLIDYLADRDISCPGCGYNLRGLNGSACPECAADLSLRVGLTEPRLATLIAVLVLLSSGLGFNLFILGWAMIQWVWWGFPPSEFWPLIVGSAVLGGAVLFILRHRRWLRERGRAGRSGVIVASALMSLGSVCLFFATVAV